MGKFSFEKIVSHVKTSGFVFQGSEIYNGLANSWDYGPLGCELKKNVKDSWWKKFVQENPLNVGLDSAILMNPKVWEASGHLTNFTDPLMDCKNCKTRHRADKLIEDFAPNSNCESWTNEEMFDFIRNNKIACPHCGSHDFTDIRKFQLMFKTFMGVVEDSKSAVYLRPETAQGIFVNFRNIQRTTRRKLPFGVCQTGKVFRNEITPGNFIFRTREFEQLECEFFCKPGTDLDWYDYWKKECMKFVTSMGVKEDHIRLREHAKEELAHYSKGTSDIEYLFPFGWGELWGISDRGDYDLSQHMKHSGQSMEYLDQELNSKYVPYVVEPSLGVDRFILAILCEAYDEEEVKEGDTRVVMHFHPALAPIKICVMPLSKQLTEQTTELYTNLCKHYRCEYDEAGSIGKRYRRQDAVGTPLCITYDFDSVEDQSVTVRDRDTMQQVRVKIADLPAYLEKVFEF